MKFGYLTNYDAWAFVKRGVVVNENTGVEEEMLYATRWFSREEAGLAWAYFTWLVVTQFPNDDDVMVPKGEIWNKYDANSAKQGGDAAGPADDAGGRDTGEAVDEPDGGGGGGGGGGGVVEALDQEEEEEDPWACVDPSRELTFKPWSTHYALGINNFSNLKDAVTLSDTYKSCVLRATVKGRDLVARQVDMHNLPHHSEFTVRGLEEMMNREHAAYTKLRPLWGFRVPHLVNIGPDFGPLWTTITTYEGESLAKLKEEGRLDQDTVRRAREALQDLHENGVMHGDIELRNAVRRESDGAVLWVDLEFAELVEGDALVQGAQQEMDAFDALVAEAAEAAARSPQPETPPSRDESPQPRSRTARVCPTGGAGDCTKRARVSTLGIVGWLCGTF